MEDMTFFDDTGTDVDEPPTIDEPIGIGIGTTSMSVISSSGLSQVAGEDIGENQNYFDYFSSSDQFISTTGTTGTGMERDRSDTEVSSEPLDESISAEVNIRGQPNLLSPLDISTAPSGDPVAVIRTVRRGRPKLHRSLVADEEKAATGVVRRGRSKLATSSSKKPIATAGVVIRRGRPKLARASSEEPIAAIGEIRRGRPKLARALSEEPISIARRGRPKLREVFAAEAKRVGRPKLRRYSLGDPIISSRDVLHVRSVSIFCTPDAVRAV